MKTVSALYANQDFSRILGEAEAGQEIVITCDGRPVAVLSPYREQAMTPERQAAVERAIALMENAPAIGSQGRFNRQEIYDEPIEELWQRRQIKGQ